MVAKNIAHFGVYADDVERKEILWTGFRMALLSMGAA
jgi:hypothetical protein